MRLSLSGGWEGPISVDRIGISAAKVLSANPPIVPCRRTPRRRRPGQRAPSGGGPLALAGSARRLRRLGDIGPAGDDVVSTAAIHNPTSPIRIAGIASGPASPTIRKPIAVIWTPVFHFASEDTGSPRAARPARNSRRPEIRNFAQQDDDRRDDRQVSSPARRRPAKNSVAATSILSAIGSSMSLPWGEERLFCKPGQASRSK